jgi:colanic acid/amylovoran biosynthesis glycosyltransferase
LDSFGDSKNSQVIVKICITRSERYAYSETFIRDQITGLSKLADVYPIHSSRLPERAENGRLLSPFAFWILHKIVKVITGKRNNFFGNYGIKKYLRDNKIDVVIANYGLAAAHLAPICKHASIPLLVIFHGHDATDKRIMATYSKKYIALFEYASAVIVVSNAMHKHIMGMGAEPSKVHVVPCGVNVDKFTATESPKERLFLAVGRLVNKKGPLFTIQAFHQVWQRHPDMRLMVVGAKQGLYDKCVALVESLGMQQAVTFTGILDQDAIQKLMHRALAFVQHSVTTPNGDMEGTPVSILEAAASGLPVISTLHGGIKDAVLQGVTGYLVEEKDVLGMADYMEALLQNPAHASLMGKAAREHVIANYKQENQIKKLYLLSARAANAL